MTTQRRAAAWDRPCPYCGATVLTFTDELGCQRYLDPGDPPARMVLPEGHTWELSMFGSIGWYLMDIPRRGWRPIRLEHLCTGNANRLSGRRNV